MAIGQVTIVKVDGMSGDFATPERLFLYVGRLADPDLAGQIIPVGASSDLDSLLGAGESELKTQITAARQNARSENFVCYALGVTDGDDWKEAVLAALDKPSDLNVEAIVLCTPFETSGEVSAAMATASEVLARFAKFVSVIGCVSGISESESWGEYITRISAVTDGIAAERVMVVPLLHGNDLGCVSGRLCDPAVSIADTPMRVATGALIGLGEAPADKNGSPLIMATIQTLSERRFCVPQWYSGYDGTYWADMMTLAPEASDYQVYENLRVVDYCARRVRILAIARIANRMLNNTSASIAANKTYFARPLREASQPVTLGGVELPATIRPPEDGDITIVWNSRTDVSIGLTVRPYNCPKKITVYLGLDLSGN